MELPLLPDIGWAVIDYLKYGRPKVEFRLCICPAHGTVPSFFRGRPPGAIYLVIYGEGPHPQT